MNVSLENLKRNKNYFKWILWSFAISIFCLYGQNMTIENMIEST